MAENQFNVTPYEKSEIAKLPKLPDVNYTAQDFWSLKTRFRDFIKEQFSDDFNNFIESDLGVMLLENWAFIADTLSFKIDQIANEIFIDTVGEVDNAFRLAMLVGFKPTPPVGARSLWSASINNVLTTDLVIEAPVEIAISTDVGPRTIELYPADAQNQPILDQNIVISAGSFTTMAIVGVEGKTYLQSSVGDGLSNQFIELIRRPVIYNSVRVFVDGFEWTQVDYFSNSGLQKEFRVEYDPGYGAYVMFGTTKSGMPPALGSQIEISYRAGGGTVGNIVTGSVESQKNFQVPGFGYRLPVTFRNYTKGEYGYAGDTIEDIKRKLPIWVQTQDRVVSGQDIEAFTNQFVSTYNGQIGKGKAILRNYGCSGNIIDLYVLARKDTNGLIKADTGLKQELQAALEEKKMLTQHICIKDGYVVETDVTIDITMNRFYRKQEDEYRTKINDKINGFFSLINWDYGKILKAVDLIKALSDLPELGNVDIHLNTPDTNGEVITTRFYEIIRPNIININFVYE